MSFANPRQVNKQDTASKQCSKLGAEAPNTSLERNGGLL